MAGDWFPMGFWRSRCPEVVLIASLSGRTRHEVLGWLCDLWSWCSSETDDGLIRGVKVTDLPSVIGGDVKLWEAVVTANWLAEDEAGIVIPGWDNWLCESAKKRAKERVKKRRQRSQKCPKSVPKVSPKRPPKKGTTEQDRREEKNTPQPPAGAGGDAGAGTPVEFPTERAPNPGDVETLWNAQKNLVPCKASDTNRDRTIRYWATTNPDWVRHWRAVIEFMGRTPHYHGANGLGWKAPLSWLFDDGNFAKVCDKMLAETPRRRADAPGVKRASDNPGVNVPSSDPWPMRPTDEAA